MESQEGRHAHPYDRQQESIAFRGTTYRPTHRNDAYYYWDNPQQVFEYPFIRENDEKRKLK